MVVGVCSVSAEVLLLSGLTVFRTSGVRRLSPLRYEIRNRDGG